MTFSTIKPKIKNLGGYNTLADIKRDGLRVAYNHADDSYWLIEGEFLKPVIKSPRECKSIVVKSEDLKYKIFMCGKSREELRGSFALRYIEWGEERGFDKRPSCRGRKRWWEVGERTTPFGIIPCSYRGTFVVYRNGGVLVDKRLYELETNKERDSDYLLAYLNSSLYPFFLEMQTRSYGGGGGPIDATVYEIASLYILKPSSLPSFRCKELNNAFDNLTKRESKNIFDEIRQPDRRALDAIIFDALELTDDEREAVYSAVSDLVRRRLEKARSV